MGEAGSRDAFGHAQLGGVGSQIAQLVKAELNYKVHWALPDYLQRSARHLASRTDAEQAYAVGRAALEFALAGHSAVMAGIERLSDAPYAWRIAAVPLGEVANREKMMPPEFIGADGYTITDACRRYLQPLVEGEDYPPYAQGLPAYVRVTAPAVAQRLPAFRA